MAPIDQIQTALLSKIKELPPMPANVMKLRAAVANPNANFTQLVPILKEDPSICADILRIANSAVFGVGHSVETIDEAVRYFGMNSLVEFVAYSCSDKIIKQSFSAIAHLNEYSDHSRQVSEATAFVTNAFGLSAREREVYSLTGLLHDIGRLVILLFTDSKQYCEEAMGVNWEEVYELVGSEKALYGIDHADLGMRICRKWQFPERIIQGVQYHHMPIINDKIFQDGLILFFSEIITIPDMPDAIVEMALPKDVIQEIGIPIAKLIEARHKYFDSLSIA